MSDEKPSAPDGLEHHRPRRRAKSGVFAGRSRPRWSARSSLKRERLWRALIESLVPNERTDAVIAAAL
jgi:hypothetical protein